MNTQTAKTSASVTDIPAAPWTMRVPVLSALHIRPETAQYIHEHGHQALNTFAGYVGGWFFYVGEFRNEMDFHSLPADLRDVFAWAENNGHEWIRLDATGDIINSLPTYGWGDDGVEALDGLDSVPWRPS